MFIEQNHLFTLEYIDDILVKNQQFEDIVLVYVEAGSVMMSIDYNKFQLEQNQIFIVNPSNTISISDSHHEIKGHMYLIHLNTYEVQLILEKPFVIFTNLENHASEEWYAICKVMKDIVSYYTCAQKKKKSIKASSIDASGNTFSKLMQYTFFCQLLNVMIPFLLSEQDCVYENAPIIMNQVFWYIQSHYANHITLQKISEQFYVSDSSLSRWIKQYTGMPFEKYLRKLRAVHCAMEIGNTDKSITEIALKHGFANPAALNKAFHEFYQMTPGQYRKLNSPHWEKGTVYYTQK